MASTLTYSDLIARFPEFTPAGTSAAVTAEQTRINLFLSDAEEETNRDLFGDSEDLAVLLRAAHHLALARRNEEQGGGGTGPVSARTINNTVISYNSTMRGDGYDEFRTTTYGVRLLSLIKRYVPTGFSSAAGG